MTVRLLDLHQHAWTETLLAALARRDAVPFVRRSPDGLTVLHSAGEQPYVIAPDPLTASGNARRERLAGAEYALISISSPIGIEALDADAAAELIAAHLDGTLSLGTQFGAWGPLALADPDPAQVDALLGRGCAGISVAAGAIATHGDFERIGPALAAVEQRGAVLLVHPGPGPGPEPGPRGATHPGAAPATRPAEPSPTDPRWWPALTSYVEQMQRAWLTFFTRGRRELPELRVVFAMLAGGAPLLAERLLTRGGPDLELRDPRTFYDTSSYGPKMVETMARWVGPSQLVYGSDRPVIDALTTGREVELMSNAAALLPVPTAVA
jgi:hypothetical protein